MKPGINGGFSGLALAIAIELRARDRLRPDWFSWLVIGSRPRSRENPDCDRRQRT